MKDEQILEQFLSETQSNITAFDSELLLLEKEPSKLELLQSAYRRMHTIKGMAGYFPFPDLQNLVHNTENTFSSLMELNEIERTKSIVGNKLIDSFFAVSDDLKKQLEDIRVKNSPKSKAKLSPLQMKALESLNTTKTEVDIEPNAITIDINVLESLNSLSSELVLLKNQLEAKIKEPELNRTDLESIAFKIEILTQKMNKKMLQVRMQRLSTISNKLKKIVRDIAHQCNKQVDFTIEGENIEIDRNILDLIRDPLIHILRNAIDHGIEDAETRASLGKGPIAHIKLKAAFHKNRIFLHISDDGRGISIEGIKQKAIEKKLINETKLEQISNKEIMELIFLPGFSTSEQVTKVSGRGIGMDVVKTNINKLNSTIEIISEENKGTEFVIKLPLTLAVESALIVTINETDYLIPASSIKEVGKIAREQVSSEKQIDVRGKTLPLICSSQLLYGIPCESNSYYIDFVVIDLLGTTYAFAVNAIKNLQNIVFKSLPEINDRLDYFAGATIMPDGSVGLILNMEKIYKEPKMVKSYQLMVKANIRQRKVVEEIQPETVLSFKLADQIFAIDYNLVKEIAIGKKVTNIPGSELSGVFNLRNNLIPVKKISQNDNTLIVLDSPQEGLLSITVDEMGKIMSFSQAVKEDIKLFPIAYL